MTSPDQQGQPSRDNHKPLEDTQQLTGRSSRSRHKSGRLWIGLSVIVLAGLSAALIFVATGGTHQAASSNAAAGPGTAASTSGSSSGSTVPKGTSTANGRAISAAQLAEEGGALGLPKFMQSQVIRWHTGPGGTHLAAVTRSFGDALQAAGARQYSSMRHACAQLAGNVATAEAGPQIPESVMQNLYAKALVELAKGAADCQTAISVKPNGDEAIEVRLDTALLRQSVSELGTGANDIFRSTAEIEISSRQHH
jgi:hypothetical protein